MNEGMNAEVPIRKQVESESGEKFILCNNCFT